MNFLDYIVVIGYLAILLYMGFALRQQENKGDYFCTLFRYDLLFLGQNWIFFGGTPKSFLCPCGRVVLGGGSLV